MQDAGKTLAVNFSGRWFTPLRFTRQGFTGTGLTGRIFRRNPEANVGPREGPGWPAAAASLQLSGTTHAEKERMLSERQVELRRSLPRQPSVAFASPGEGRQFSLIKIVAVRFWRSVSFLIASKGFSRERSTFRKRWQVKRIM
jgi:hypothetical protein